MSNLPVGPKDGQSNDDEDPENFSNQFLVGQEDVDESLDGRIGGVVLDQIKNLFPRFLLEPSLPHLDLG